MEAIGNYILRDALAFREFAAGDVISRLLRHFENGTTSSLGRRGEGRQARYERSRCA